MAKKNPDDYVSDADLSQDGGAPSPPPAVGPTVLRWLRLDLEHPTHPWELCQRDLDKPSVCVGRAQSIEAGLRRFAEIADGPVRLCLQVYLDDPA